MECTCKIEKKEKYIGVDIYYIVKCPLCRAAPKLVEACKFAQDRLFGEGDGFAVTYDKLWEALAEVEKGD